VDLSRRDLVNAGGVAALGAITAGDGSASIAGPVRQIQGLAVERPQQRRAATLPFDLETFGATPGADIGDTTHAEANAAALLAAIAEMKGILGTAGSPSGRSVNRPKVKVGAGAFVFPSWATNLIDFSGFDLEGAGMSATAFIYAGSKAFFDFGTFSATPKNLFGGAAQGYRIADLSIINPTKYGLTDHGTRTGQGIRDSGSGAGMLQRVRIGGFAYGFNEAYGSDFTTTQDCIFELCDVGHYIGPGSQQNEHRNPNYYLCNEGAVMDRPAHILFTKPTFNSCKVANLKLEANATSTTTRQLSSFSTSGTSFQSDIVVDTPWFEGNAGGLGENAVPTHHFEIRNANAEAYRDIVIRSAYIVSGRGGRKATTAFVGCTGSGANAQRVIVDGPVFHGVMSYWLHNPNGTILRNRRTTNGYSDPIVSDNDAAIVRDDFANDRRGRLPFDRTVSSLDGAAGFRERVSNIPGIIGWSFVHAGSCLQRMGVDIRNQRFVFDDPEVANPRSISVEASAAPSSGSFGAGSLRISQTVGRATPVATRICTASGAPGNWGAASWMVFRGITAHRPVLGTGDVGVMYFDATLAAAGKPIWWTGMTWVDSAGTPV